MALRMSKRLQKEYEAIQKNNQDLKVNLPNNDLSLWHVNFLGAKGTLFEGESFNLQLRFNNEYVFACLLSQFSLQKSSSLGTFQFTNTYILMGSSVSRFCMTVIVRLCRVVACAYGQFNLSFSAVDVE